MGVRLASRKSLHKQNADSTTKQKRVRMKTTKGLVFGIRSLIVIIFGVTTLMSTMYIGDAIASQVFGHPGEAEDSYHELIQEAKNFMRLGDRVDITHYQLTLNEKSYVSVFAEPGSVTTSTHRIQEDLRRNDAVLELPENTVQTRFLETPEKCTEVGFPCACRCAETEVAGQQVIDQPMDILENTPGRRVEISEVTCVDGALSCEKLPINVVDNWVVERPPEGGIRYHNIQLAKTETELQFVTVE